MTRCVFDAERELTFLTVRVAGELRDTLQCLDLDGLREDSRCYWHAKAVAYSDVLGWLENIERRREMLK